MKFYFAGPDGGSHKSLVKAGAKRLLWSFGRKSTASGYDLKKDAALREAHEAGVDVQKTKVFVPKAIGKPKKTATRKASR